MSIKSIENRQKFRNKFCENDISYDIELNRYLMRIIGAWPTISARARRISRVAIFTSVVLLIFFFVPQGCYIFLIEKDSTAKLRMVGPLSFTAMAIAKYTIMLVRNADLETCIASLENDWRNADEIFCRPVMLRYSRESRIFTKIYAAFTYGGVGFYTWILPFVRERDNGNLTSRPLAYPSEFYVFDANNSPTYEIIFLGHAMSMLAVVCTVTCGVCTMTVKFVLHACGQYEIVVALLRYVDDHFNLETNDDCTINFKDLANRRIFIERSLANIIKRHLHATVFVSRIEKVLNETCLVDLAGSMISICVLGYLLMEWRKIETIGIITYIMLMMSFVMNVFVLCYIGERLTEQSRRVGEAGYMMNWWGLPEAQARALILVIATSDIPVKFTAGKMFCLSMQTFGSVMKAALAYLNALRAVM